jgi:CRISPR-associated protein Cmr6
MNGYIKYKGNLGYFYYREYFDGVDWGRPLKESIPLIQENSHRIISDSRWYSSAELTWVGSHSIKLTTLAPGLLIGSGSAHELGIENELKLGLSFDHTSGWPYIPGSSVKGVLRSAFQHHDYFQELLSDIPENQKTKEIFLDLEREIFMGIRGKEAIGFYERDCFLDAHITKAEDKILNDDYITPHRHKDRTKSHLDSFVNPIPIRFLRVEPGVEFTFSFILQDSRVLTPLKKDSKLQLFAQILKDLGVGAKTNVGYGGLE